MSEVCEGWDPASSLYPGTQPDTIHPQVEIVREQIQMRDLVLLAEVRGGESADTASQPPLSLGPGHRVSGRTQVPGSEVSEAGDVQGSGVNVQVCHGGFRLGEFPDTSILELSGSHNQVVF